MHRPLTAHRSIAILAGLLLLAFAAPLRADSLSQEFSDFTIPMPLPPGSLLVIGFVGGWERWDNETRCVRKQALRLRELKLPGTYVETVENHKRHLAMQLVEKAFPDAALARIILFGQSMGGAAVVKFSRELDTKGYRVLLAVIVDSFGRDDRVLSPNVAEAANLYQRDGWPVRGEPQISPQNPSRTKMLGNFRYSYKQKEVDISYEPGTRKRFSRAHAHMEYDPEVWARVEWLIVEAARRALHQGELP